uniref:NADH-ubiquinone oxidoreductase chain 4 n=1 Tax=Coleoptera sp. ACP-2013 TaxID=2485033 RepID=A0A3G3MES2_9COLE|nr:NADH dehydrogenase subunit 4 [Coleoptera sp. ACP-2013]
MMMFILGLVFMIPLVFYSCFWLICIYMFFMSFIFMLKLNLFFIMSYLSFSMGVDLLSYFLILLSFWICSLMVLASGLILKEKYFYKNFLLMILILMFSLFLTFCSTSFFMFYLFFEISLIPTLVLIIGWGNQPERISAGMYLFFYTMLVSLPMMMALFYLSKYFYTLNFYYFYSLDNVFLYLGVNMVFFVKMPMFFVHLWLPKAHVEAPISGSMILAGVMLKLGGYGLLRSMKLFIEIGLKVNIIFILISLVGGVIVSLICVRQSDMKKLIAYSSVCHMGMAMGGILTFSVLGFWGGLVLMVSHGLCSSGLFCLANLLYERSHSRSIYLNKGMMNIFPSLSLWWFLLCSSNMSAPPSLNLVGEILLISSLIFYSKLFLLILFFLVVFSAIYSMFLYSYTQHGKLNSNIYSYSQINIREYLLLFLHWVPLNLIILKMEFFLI